MPHLLVSPLGDQQTNQAEWNKATQISPHCVGLCLLIEESLEIRIETKQLLIPVFVAEAKHLSPLLPAKAQASALRGII